jgi:hypothetical protein
MANEWNKTAFVEFETMLRRRLRSGAAPVAACAGFDLDAASAYLEGALGGSHRAGYESHLAGCATCRRHLIELARLAQTTPLAEAQPVAITNQTPALARLREVVASWFDFSAWNLKWRLAGATGAAFAILIAALGAQSWRQAHNRTAAVRMPSATPPAQADVGVQPASNELSAQAAAILVPYDSTATYPGQSRASVPAPGEIGPKGNAPEFEVKAAASTLAPPENQPGEAPAPARSDIADAAQNQSGQQVSPASMGGSGMTGGTVMSAFRRDSKEQAASDPVQSPRITLPEGYNPMTVGQTDPDPSHRTLASNNGKTPPASPKSGSELQGLPDKIKRKILSFGPNLFNESERRAKPDKQEASEGESPNPMLIPIRDKVFRFEKGMLIDQEYNPEMQKWRVWTLKSGSEQYKQVLAAEPQLKEFFDRCPILIVWKNKIYKALK